MLGVGGNVSQGILKALELGELRCRVVGACISHHSAGLYTVDRAYVSPRADDPAFADWLVDVCRAERVDAVLSGTEPVVRALAEEAGELHRLTGAVALVSSPEQVEIGLDKLATARWLTDHGFAAPGTAAAGDGRAVDELVEAAGYPLIAKPRRGKSSQGVIRVEGPADLDYVRRRSDYLVQEHLEGPEAEYTVACFSDRDGRVRGTLAMRRGLQEGTTVWAEVGEFPDVREEARRIAAALRPLGPCNVQLRLSGGRPVCFEINVRFSGTAPLRARLGFNDVEAALRHYVLGEQASDLPSVTEGVALRYWNEIYVDPAASEALRRSGRLDDPGAHPLVIEDYGTGS